MKKILIFDTTLRDGEQAPGASLNDKEKIEVARQLEALGVDIIEAGFPISSKGDFESVRRIAKEVKKSYVCGLARSLKKDIDACRDAIKPAKKPYIHVFLATSKIHMQYKLKKAEAEIVRQAVEAVKYARKFCSQVEFSPEDASRTEKEFLYRVVESVIKAGAKTVNIPDTVGYSEPEEFGRLIKDITDNVPNINKAIISVHCHNDLGLAVANSLAAIRNGAGQVECTINGIGERAGNASMEEIVMTIATRKDIYPFKTNIKKEQIHKTSRLVSKLTGFVIAPNKAIVGGNAFRHESGIHQDGVLKKRSTYEIIKPEDVGFTEEGLVLGKHSGRHAFNERLKSLGIILNKKEIDKAFERFKDLADKKKEVFDEDLVTIVEDEFQQMPEMWQLVSWQANVGNDVKPEAKVCLKKKGKTFCSEASGDGPIDSCYKAIEKITKTKCKLMDYSIKSVTSGKDALGEVRVELKSKNKIFSGRGASTDIIEASVKAYLNALNKFLFKASERKPVKL